MKLSRSRPHRGSALFGAAATVLMVGGCHASSPRALPAAPPTVVVTMRDVGGYRIDYNPVIPAGRVVFKVVNAGRLVHRLALLPLPEDFPPIDEQLHGSERQTLTPFAGVPDHLPGETATFAVDLAPAQRYALVCFAEDPDGGSHALMGMNSEFRTTGDATPRDSAR